MADLKWLDGLGGPQINGYSREEVVGFIENDLAAGPAFIEVFSDDTPQFHSVSYIFKRGDARRFEMWLRENKVKSRSPWFDGPIPTPDNTVETQECRFTADGYPQLTGQSSGGTFTYSAKLLTRSIVNNDDDYATEVDAMWGTNNGDINLGSSLLDEGLDALGGD